MTTGRKVHEVLSFILSIAIFVSSVFPRPSNVVQTTSTITTSKQEILPLSSGLPYSDLSEIANDKLNSDAISNLADLTSFSADGEPNGLLLDVAAWENESNNLQPRSLTNPFSLAHIQSAYTADSAINNTVVVTFTIANNQRPAVNVALEETTTITETLENITSLDFSNDPNVIHNVIVKDELLPPGAVFIDSDPLPDRQGDTLTWNLGDVLPLESITLTLKLQVPPSSTNFSELDTGAMAWGTLHGRAVVALTSPATLAPDGYSGWLNCTIDANCNDRYVIQKAAELGNDPQAIFGYVRSLAFESYKGSLRGARGTMWSEAGNSLDQSSLLIALLRASGIPASYRNGALEPPLAQQLILSMFSSSQDVIGHIPEGTEVADPANDPQFLAETVDHWWVQAYLPDVGWTDLDPSFANAFVGDSFVPFPEPGQLAEVPDNLRHKVTISVKVEQHHPLNLGNSGLTNVYPLVHTFNAVELVGEPVTLGHGLNTASQGGAIFYYVQHTYVPYFSIGQSNIIMGESFQDLISNFPFGTFITTGEWLVFDIHDPDGNTEHYEREVVDRVGFANRQSGGTINIGENVGTEPIVTDLDVFSIILGTDINADTAWEAARSAWDEYTGLVTQIPDPDLYESLEIDDQNLARHKLRLTLESGAEAIGINFYAISSLNHLNDSLMLVRRYAATPRLSIVSMQLQGDETVTLAIDLFKNETRSIAYPGQSLEMEQVNQFLTGVYDSTLESLLLPNSSNSKTVGIVEVFEAAQNQSVELVEFTPHPESKSQLTSADMSALAKARINVALEDGKHVVVPERMVQINGEDTIMWLEIDPETGATISNSEQGLHQGSLEYTWVHRLGIVLIFLLFGFVQGYALAGDIIGDIKTIIDLENQDPAEVLRAISELVVIVLGGILEGSFITFKLGPVVTFLVVVGIVLGVLAKIFVWLDRGVDPPLPPYLMQAPDADKSLTNNIVSGNVDFTAQQASTAFNATLLTDSMYMDTGEDALSLEWSTNASSIFQFESLTAESSTLYDLQGMPIATGTVQAIPITVEATATVSSDSASIDVQLNGEGKLSFYAPSLSGLSSGSGWSVYSADLTAIHPFTLTLESTLVTVNATDVYSGSFMLVTSEVVTVEGNGHTAVPNFANESTFEAQNGRIAVGPATGSANIGSQSIDVSNGLTLANYSGPITITEVAPTIDQIELNGDAEYSRLVLSPQSSVTDPNTSVTVQASIEANFSDTYTVTVEAPTGWLVDLGPTGLITTTPPLGTEPADYSILVTAEPAAYPGLFSAAVYTVTTTAFEGMALAVLEDPRITVPIGPTAPNAIPAGSNNGQIQLPDAAYTVNITNTSTTAHAFDITVSGLPTEWIILGGNEGVEQNNITLPAGGIGQVGLYISPTLPLASPGTNYPFNVTATAVDNPSLTQTESVVFTIPAIPFNYVTGEPQLIYVAPDTISGFDLIVENIGNADAVFPITVTLPFANWTGNYINTTGLLTEGNTFSQSVTFTPIGATVGSNHTIRIHSPAPGTEYVQSTSVQVAIRTQETVCAYEALHLAPEGDVGLIAALDNLFTQLELWRDLNNLTQRDHTVTALQSVVTQLSFYPGLSVTAQLSDLAVQISGHTDTGDLANDRVVLGNLLCQDLQPALTLLSAYNPGFSNFPAVAATVPGRTVTTTLTAVNHGDSPATAEFTLSNVPAGWDVTAPTQVSLVPGAVQQIPLPITPNVLGTDTFSVTMRFSEAPQLAITRTMTVRVVSELLTITAVDLDPAELNVGTGTTDVSIHLANPAGFRASTTAEVQLTDGTGTVRKSFSTPFTVPVNNSGPFLLGQLDIDGLEEGVYTTTVRLLDTDDSLIPNAVGLTHLPIGQDLRVTYDLTPALVAPGQTGVTATTTITTERTDVLTTTVPFTPTIKWTNSIPSDGFSAWNQVIAMPVIGDINGDGIPDVVYNSYQGINWFSDGIIRVASGDDGSEIFKVTAQRTMPMGTPTIVDLDNDGAPEILVHRSGGGLYAFDNTGGLKYSSTAVYTGNPQFGSSPTIADLNGDGFPEVIIGRNVLNNTLSSLTSLGSGGQSGEGRAVMSVVADVDLDGDQEVIAGNTIYHGSGGILAQNTSIADGFNAIGNFNTDPYPEIVMVAAGAMYLLDNQMNIIWGPVVIPGGGSGPQNGNGGPPTVADFDNDGLPEIGVAGLSSYRVIDTDGTLLWARSSVDNSGVTGSSVFDFQGDGQAEVVYGDENNLYIYDGSDGTILFQQPRPSATVTDGPVVADVDGDGHADIIVPANTGFGGSYTGIRVFQAVDNSWVNTRQLWYQHAYDIVSVDDDMRVVTNPSPVWQVYNTFRTQAPTPVQGNAYFVDIVHGLAITNTSLLTDTVSPTPLQATAEQIHWLYAQQDREAIKVAQLSQSIDSPLQPGEARPLSTGTVVSYTLNSNTTVVNIPPLYVSAPHIISMAPEEVTVSPGATAVYTVTLTNAFATAQTIDLNVVGLNDSWVTFTDTVTLASSETVELPLIVSVPAGADAVAYPVMVQALLTGGGEDVTSAVLNVGSGPELSVSPPLQFAAYGDTVTYTVTLTNTAAQAEQYTFTTDGLAGLPVDLPAAVNLAPGETASDVLTVTAQTRESTLPFVVQATGDTGLSAGDEAGLGVLNGPGVQATLSPQTAVAGKGSPVLYTLTVTNTGSIQDVYSFNFNLPAGWSYQLLVNGEPVSELALSPHVFNSAELDLFVISAATTPPATYPVQVVVTSQSDPATSTTADAQTQVVSQGVQVDITPDSVSMDPTGSQTWSVTVTNSGELFDTFVLSASGIVSATAQFSPATVSLNPGQSTVVQLSAADLDFALPTTYPFAVTARSTTNPLVFDFDEAEATFNGFEDVSVAISPTLKTVEGFAAEHTFMVVITNTGNVGTIYQLSTDIAPSGTAVGIDELYYIPAHMAAAIPVDVQVSSAGTYLITVQADSESQAASDSATATLVINVINTAPDAVDDDVTTPENTAVSINVLANDTDADGDSLTITGVTTPTNGTAVINPDNTVTYTPNVDFSGSDSFSYTISDGNGGSDTAAVTITVDAVNDDPVAVDDTATTPEDTAVIVDVLANDTDPEGDTLTVTGVTTPTSGTAVVNPDDTVTYTPDTNFNGGDSFNYTISDGNGGSATAVVTVTVTAVNDNPVAVVDSATTAEDTAVIINVLANDSDVDGDTLAVSAVVQPGNGLVVINPDNTITYTPDPDFNSTDHIEGDDSFTYTVSDGNGGSDTATVTVTVTPVNDNPAAVDDNVTTPEDTAVTINVLANDTDVEGDTLTITSVTQPANGSVVNNGTDVTYTPDANFNGSDSFSYTVEDGNGGSDTATVTVLVNPANDAPVAVDDSATTAEDTAVTIPVLTNDTDVDGDALTVTAVTTPTKGTAVLNPDSTITYTPNANFNGSDSFSYTVNDGNGGNDTAVVSVTVTPVNDVPAAVDDSVTTPEDTAAVLNVLGNDTDIDGDALTVTSVSSPANGTAVINPDNTVTYTPDANFNGSDSFSYTISDGNGGSDTAAVSITVTPVNDAPLAVDDVVSTAEDTAVTVPVLANDSDVDGDTLSVTGVTTPTNGTAVINPDNTVTYTPNANFNGSDSFSYTVEDGNGGSDTATVSVTVTPVNDAPTAANDSATTPEDTAVTLNVLANDSDVDGDLLTVATTTAPANGTVVVNLDDTITYTPDANFNGSDSFSYTVSDGNGGSDTATVSVTVTPVNDAPLAVDDAVSTAEDTAVTIDVLSNDTDVEGDSLTVTAVTTPTNGTAVINPDDTITYTPDANYNGSDSFSYTVEDGNGGSDTATVSVTVTPLNDAPLAVDDAVSTAEDTAVSIDVLANDSDVDGDSLTVASVNTPANGTAVINLDDSVTYTPNTGFNGSDSFSYTVEDGNGGSDTATVTVTVTAENDNPAAVDDSATTPEDTAVTVDVLANDSDVDGDTLSVSGVTAPTNGTAVINPDDSITYTPDANFNGSDSFSYTVEDGNGGSDSATVSVTVTPVNDAPLAVDDAVSTAEDTAVTIDVLSNDTDVEGDSLTVTAVTTPTNGTAVINPDDTITYTPDANFNGSDSFSYTVEDGNGGSDTATVSVTVTPINDAPLAVDDTVSTAEDTAVSIDVLANDSDVDGGSLAVASVGTPANGTVVINPDDTVTYTPNTGFNGTDSFSYTVEDGNGGTDVATVTVTVSSVNDVPVAVDDAAATAEDTAVTVDVLANDTDADGDVLTVTEVTTPTNGTAIINPDNTITYTPDGNFNGSDSFSYTVEDGNGGSDTATVSVTVTAINDAPLAVNDSAATAEDTAVTIDVLANDSDVDEDSLTVTAVTTPTNGTAVLNPDSSITYTPDANFHGSDSFSYTIEDGNGGTDTATVAITVTPVNDAPVAVDDSATTLEDTAVTIDVLANDSDIDGDTLVVSEASQAGSGTVVVNLDNTITYTPDPDFNSLDSIDGTDVFTYTVSDGSGGTSVAAVTITVTPVNDAPDAADDQVSTDEDTAVTIDVLANDSDVDGDTLTVTGVTTPTNGTVVINPDNTVTYMPDANFNGADSFTYTVEDGNGESDTAVVTIAVSPANDTPVAANDSATTAEDTPVTVDVLANDSDVDGDTLTVTGVTTPTSGTAVINPDNSITYTPEANFNGSDSFTYTVDDGGDSDTATVTITVTPVNDAPIAADDAVTTAENTAITIDVLANDSDVDGDSLTVTAVTTPTNGTAVLNPDSSITFMPDANFSGADSFSYTVEDGNGGTDTAVVNVTVTAENDNPVAVNDSATTPEDTAVTIDVLANDSDADGDTLTVTAVTAPTNGTAVINPDNSITYTPDANFYGSDSFSYEVEDGSGGSDSAIVTVTVTPVNDAPLAENDAATTPEDTAVTVDVLANDSDGEGDALTIQNTTAPANGTAVVNPDGTITYTPDTGFNGIDSFTYTVSDGNGGTDTATVTVVVTPVVGSCDLYPIALHEATLDGAAVGDIIEDILNGKAAGNFGWLTWSGENGVPSLVASLTPPGNSYTYVNPNDPNDHTVSLGDWVEGKPGVSNARAVRDALDTLKSIDIVVPVWDLDAGSGANVEYRVVDFALVRILDYQLPQQDRITVQFLGFTACEAGNANPVAQDDGITALVDMPVVIDALANDTDNDGDTLAIQSVGAPAHGTAVLNPDKTITYTPNAGFVGTDTFLYTVTDGRGETDTATVTVVVAPEASDCDLYPIALHVDTLEGAAVGDIIENILNGKSAGNFGWLTWSGDNGMPMLIESLGPPGNSHTYINPHDSADHIVTPGDWVHGKPGVSNTQDMRQAMDTLKSLDIVVPVWDTRDGGGANVQYHIVSFAVVRIVDYQLAQLDQITVQFLGYATCGAMSEAPGSGVVMADQIWVSAVNPVWQRRLG